MMMIWGCLVVRLMGIDYVHALEVSLNSKITSHGTGHMYARVSMGVVLGCHQWMVRVRIQYIALVDQHRCHEIDAWRQNDRFFWRNRPHNHLF